MKGPVALVIEMTRKTTTETSVAKLSPLLLKNNPLQWTRIHGGLHPSADQVELAMCIL